MAIRVLPVQQLVPPTEEEVTSDEFEPWGERVSCSARYVHNTQIVMSRVMASEDVWRRRTRGIKHSLKLCLVDVLPVPNLVEVGVNVHVGSQKENIVDYITSIELGLDPTLPTHK